MRQARRRSADGQLRQCVGHRALRPAATSAHASRSCAWGTKRASAAPRTTCARTRCVDLAAGRPGAGHRRRARRDCAMRRPPRNSSTRPATGRPEPDFDYCTEVDRFDFVLRLRRGSDGRLELERIAVPGRSSERRQARRPAVQLFGVPFEFVLFALTLLGVALLHHRTLEVALTGLAAVVAVQAVLHRLPRRARPARASPCTCASEWVVLANLFGLLMGFALLSRHFEASHVPARLPDYLPDDWRGALRAAASWCSCCRAFSTTSRRR